MKIAFVMLAAGNSRRFGANKLLYEIDGIPMYRHVLEQLDDTKKKIENIYSEYSDITEDNNNDNNNDNNSDIVQLNSLYRNNTTAKIICNIIVITQYDAIAEAVIKNVMKAGKDCLADPENYEARAELMLTSTLAMSGLVGMDRITCLNAHSLGEDFGGLYDLTHGATLAIVEPALLTYKVEAYLPRLVRFAKEVWGVSGEDDKAVALEGIERMKQFFRSMGVPVTFREVGIDIDKDGRMLAQRIEAFEGGSVYVDLSHEDVYQVYSLAK